MKCVSYRQPWASLVILGEKGIETRGQNWTMLAGRWHAVHASSTWSAYQAGLLDVDPFKAALARHGITRWNATHANLPRGAIIGVVFVATVVPTDTVVTISDQERAFGDYTPGRKAYYLGERFGLASPVLFTGRLGVFDLPPAIEREVMIGLQGQDLPAQFRSEDLLNEAVNRERTARLKRQEAERLLGGGQRDSRTPIDRMIDQAVGR